MSATEENGKFVAETPTYKLSEFESIKILSNNSNRKLVTILGKFPKQSEDDQAIVMFEKNAFTESELQTCRPDAGDSKKGYFSEEVELRTEFINNIYGSFQLSPPADVNSVRVTIIYPATEKHIEKYSLRAKFLIQETPILYANITEPYIQISKFSLDWVYNILEHKKEVERIAFEDADPENGFILLPDLKWNGHTPESLYMLALCHKREIKSLRDLDAKHLPMLRNIRDEGCRAIKEKYGLNENQLRIYVHYQPSFYHFHVHFNALTNEAPGIYCEKSHLLDTIIDNITLMPDYYQKATLPFVSFEGNGLLEKMLPEILTDCSKKRPKLMDKDECLT